MITEIDSVVEQLIYIYHDEEDWHVNKLSVEESRKYFNKMLMDGNIFYYQEHGEVLGYVEFYRLTFYQWGRYVCREPINPFREDVQTGNICCVNNVWIREGKRKGHVIKWLVKTFYKLNHMCDYYVGHALRKTQSQPIKVFKKSELKSSLFTKGE